MPNAHARRAVVVALIALAGTLAGNAHAQNVLGDGRALDRNLQVGSGGLLPGGVRRDPVMDQIRFNNAVITGSAIGGKSFRGSLGYRATDTFGGRLGTDDLYSFRRDAAPSGLGTVSGSDALRYQFGLTTGSRAPSFMAQTVDSIADGSLARSGRVPTGASSALRSTSEFVAERATRPALVGTRQDEFGAEFTAKASPLLGLSWVKTRESPLEGSKPVAGAPGAVPLSGMEGAARSQQSLIQRETAGGIASSADDERPAPPTLVHSRILDQLRQQAGPASQKPIDTKSPDTSVPTQQQPLPGATPTPAPQPNTDTQPPRPVTIDEQLDFLRAQLRGEAWKPKPATDPARQPGASSGVRAGIKPDLSSPIITPAPGASSNETVPAPDRLLLPIKLLQEQRAEELAQERTGKPSEEPTFSSDLLESMRRTGKTRIRTLHDIPVDPKLATQRDVPSYTAAMTEAQSLLSQNRFFDAEDRFTRALASAPGDPMARIGRVHAQMGAGLFLSAAANLRSMLKDNPELVATKYDDAVLPGSNRTYFIANELRALFEGRAVGVQKDAAFLLAYLGYQRDQAEFVNEGLEALRKHTDPDDPADRAMLRLIEGVWMP